MAGKKVIVPSEESTIEVPTHELVELLTSSAKRLDHLLGTADILFDTKLKIILGAMDRTSPPKVWSLFDDFGRIPVNIHALEENLILLAKKCTNGGVNAGDQRVLIEPAANSVVLLYFASVVNRTGVNALDITGYVRTAGGNTIGTLFHEAVDDGKAIVYPQRQATVHHAHFIGVVPFVLTDQLEFVMDAGPVVVSEDCDFFIFYEYIGDPPVFSYIQPAGAVWSDIS